MCSVFESESLLGVSLTRNNNVPNVITDISKNLESGNAFVNLKNDLSEQSAAQLIRYDALEYFIYSKYSRLGTRKVRKPLLTHIFGLE